MALDRCGAASAAVVCRSPKMAEWRFDSGKKSEFSRRKPLTKFSDNLESLSWRLCTLLLSLSRKLDKNELFGLFTIAGSLGFGTIWTADFSGLVFLTGTGSCRRTSLPPIGANGGVFTSSSGFEFGLGRSLLDWDDSLHCLGGEFLFRFFKKNRSISQSRSNTDTSLTFSLDVPAFFSCAWAWAWASLYCIIDFFVHLIYLCVSVNVANRKH